MSLTFIHFSECPQGYDIRVVEYPDFGELGPWTDNSPFTPNRHPNLFPNKCLQVPSLELDFTSAVDFCSGQYNGKLFEPSTSSTAVSAMARLHFEAEIEGPYWIGYVYDSNINGGRYVLQ